MRIKLVANPIWRYLNQQLCNQDSVWDFKRFWFLYRIEFLKHCWQQEVSQETRPFYEK